MSDAKILSEELRSFIHECVDSVAQIEVLVFIAKDRNRLRTSKEIKDELRSSESSVEHCLDLLRKCGMISNDENGQFQFSPSDEKLDRICQELIQAYSTYPIRVLEIIYNKKSDVLREFSEAFKIRKDPKDG